MNYHCTKKGKSGVSISVIVQNIENKNSKHFVKQCDKYYERWKSSTLAVISLEI